MAKKNEFVFNIGFNKENPDHVKAAGILNQMGRIKADYISQAVVFFEKHGKKRDIDSAFIDLNNLEEMVKSIIRREENKYLTGNIKEKNSMEDSLSKEEKNNISEILKGFRK